MMRRASACRTTSIVLTLLAPLAWSQSASARPTGEAQECGNCHYDTEGPVIGVVFDNEGPSVGETVLLTVELEAVNAEALRTGVFLSTENRGAFALVEPESTRFAMEGVTTAVVHSEPRVLDDEGRAQFQFEWTTPNEVGVTDFTVWSITGNSNGTSDDDHHSTVRVGIAHGCEGVLYYPDADGDGYGNDAMAQLSCEPIDGMITEGGDCDDGEAAVYPGAAELCNTRDDDCDGELDEGLEPGLYYADLDGDGFAGDFEQPEFTCNDAEGYTSERGDCEPDDPNIYPGAPELANGIDDDCDGEIDEVDPDQGGDGSSGGSDGSGGSGSGAAGQDGSGGSGGCTAAGGRLGALWLVWPLGAALWRRRRRR